MTERLNGPAGGRCGTTNAAESQSAETHDEARPQRSPGVFTTKQQKALKLIEALSEECEVMTDGDHAWRKCRACLAREELDHKGVRAMLRDLLTVLRSRNT